MRKYMIILAKYLNKKKTSFIVQVWCQELVLVRAYTLN